MAGGGGRPFPDRQKEPWEAGTLLAPGITQCDLPVLNFSGPRAFIPYALSLNLAGFGAHLL